VHTYIHTYLLTYLYTRRPRAPALSGWKYLLYLLYRYTRTHVLTRAKVLRQRTRRLPASTPALSGWKSVRSRGTVGCASRDTGAGGGEISSCTLLPSLLVSLLSEACGLSEPAALPARACTVLRLCQSACNGGARRDVRLLSLLLAWLAFLSFTRFTIFALFACGPLLTLGRERGGVYKLLAARYGQHATGQRALSPHASPASASQESP
jgi:hypothetical protein